MPTAAPFDGGGPASRQRLDAELHELGRQREAGEITVIGYNLRRNRLIHGAWGSPAGAASLSSVPPALLANPELSGAAGAALSAPVPVQAWAPRPVTPPFAGPLPLSGHSAEWVAEAVPAGFWRRAIAGYVDGCVVAGTLLLITGLLSWLLVANALTTTRIAAVFSEILLFRFWFILAAAVVALYHGILVRLWGRTIGHSALGLRVVREEAPAERLAAGRALLRAVPFWGPLVLLQILPLSTLHSVVVPLELLLLLDLLWVAWDPRKQALHDRLGGAMVVRV